MPSPAGLGFFDSGMKNNRVGITTTIPSEILFASGAVPVDLNNIFISDIKRADYVEAAEVAGFPRTVCCWIKGIYSACLDHKIKKVVAVTQGDCSNTHVLMEIHRMRGVETIPFNFPYGRDREMMERSLAILRQAFGVREEDAEGWRVRLNRIRRKLDTVDELAWRHGKITGMENHLLQVSSSDFEGDPDAFEAKVDAFTAQATGRPGMEYPARLGLIGIPPIMDGLFEFVEAAGGRVMYNEVARQFSMPFGGDSLAEQYLRYTYPYDIGPRIDDIRAEMELRSLDGLIHYVQSFCHRQMEDLIFRERLPIPILTIEADTPRHIDARTKIRLEAFIKMITQRKGAAI